MTKAAREVEMTRTNSTIEPTASTRQRMHSLVKITAINCRNKDQTHEPKYATMKSQDQNKKYSSIRVDHSIRYIYHR